MNYSPVKVRTKDNLILKGGLLKAENGKDLIIFIHGTASNFYENEFMKNISKKLLKVNFSVLSANNRVAFASGSAIEKFEDCIKDINAWIKFALSKEYKNIILMGHSLGTEKVVYYMNKGKYKNNVKSVVLFAPTDSYGSQLRFLKDKGNLKQRLMCEALSLARKGKGNKLLTVMKLCHAGVKRKSAASYIDFFKDGSELSKTFPLRNGKNLYFYRKINVPILAVLGDKDKWSLSSPTTVLRVLKKRKRPYRDTFNKELQS
jgi:pimeloyl-ACP methyl ester carboxylesterase